MGLSCVCNNDLDVGDFAWVYYDPRDFTITKTGRRKRCCSCEELINTCSPALEFERCRAPRHPIEESIYGDEVDIASWWMCEKCGEIFLNLTSVGFCVNIIENDMQSLLKEYHKLSGFKATP